MRHQLRRLMYQSLNDILQLEDYARDMAGAAYSCERDGRHGLADEMRCVGREHRIRAMEMRTGLALLERRLAELGEASGRTGDA